MSRMTSLAVALLFGILTASAQAQVADHLKCYKIKDPATKTTYKADLGGLTAEPGCVIAVPGKMLCVQTAKSNLNPPPQVPGSGPATGRFLCYKLKCAKATLAAVAWTDQFGARSVTPIGPKLLCAPEIVPTTTTTSTTLPGPSCTNGMKDGTETDVDCGGGLCPPCANGKMCLAGSDCQNSVCSTGICQAASCFDAVKNGTETDIDCGGSCAVKCANGKGCAVASDCQSSVCAGGICQVPTCTDSVKNGSETGIDCGGGLCPGCGPGQPCNVNGDCASMTCSGGTCL